MKSLFCEDCMNTMRGMAEGSVDLVIADPPYYRVKGDFDFAWETYSDYIEWCRGWIGEAFRILKPGGVLYAYQQDINKVVDFALLLRTSGFTVNSDIIWYYATGRPQKKCFRKEHEFILYCSKGEPATFNGDAVRIEFETKDRRHNPKGKSLGTVWRESRIKPNYGVATGHPTQKPALLCDRMILASSNKGDLVYVPFGGSGSEIESCVRLGRRWMASETNREFVDAIIVPRITCSRSP